MRSSTTTQSLAAASAAIVAGTDAASTVHVLVGDCARLLGACSAAVLLRVGDGALQPLASTSHVADELELLEVQSSSGPCVDAIKTGAFIELSRAEVEDRWGALGAAMDRSDVVGVQAAPMRWRGQTVGALNVFWGPEPSTPEAAPVVRAFADVATVALVQSAEGPTADVLGDRLSAALESRVPIERAKGLLAQRLGLNMAEAFDALVERSERDGEPLVRAALRVLDGHAGA